MGGAGRGGRSARSRAAANEVRATETGLGGKAAIVCGGASGIGAAIASCLREEGVQVAVLDRNEPTDIRADLGVEEEAIEAIRRADERLGSVDLLVLTPAVTRHEPVTQLTRTALEAMLSSNLVASVWTCRETARRMIEAGAGSILVVGSTAIYTPAWGESVYRASKAALKAFVEVLAIELAPHGIRANVLTPGAFATPLTAGMTGKQRNALLREIPLAREGQPRELCATALLLLSDRLSPYTTGAEFIVDGGFRLRPMPFSSGDS
jgi:NAD(P)-dependent dehydrogenase (short-subunit alcohol dehydrogenase family)